MAERHAAGAHPRADRSSSAHCRCVGCLQIEDDFAGWLIQAHAKDKAALARLEVHPAKARAMIRRRMNRAYKRSDARFAKQKPDATADDRLQAYEIFARAAERALDFLYPPA